MPKENEDNPKLYCQQLAEIIQTDQSTEFSCQVMLEAMKKKAKAMGRDISLSEAFYLVVMECIEPKLSIAELEKIKDAERGKYDDFNIVDGDSFIERYGR